MFSTPEWFDRRPVAHIRRPVTWQGWLYVASWTAAGALPAVLLLARHQVPEAGIWLAVIAAVAWRVRRAAQAARTASPPTEIINAERVEAAEIRTPQFILRRTEG